MGNEIQRGRRQARAIAISDSAGMQAVRRHRAMLSLAAAVLAAEVVVLGLRLLAQ